ncbi:MAG TPA: hypothetical protein PLI62_08260 [Spirochaetota bacterium]|nr:hypothetical protein [Spirochaetota bacterium]HQP49033.1 hypothetical protein [Spirochaetota bacterium]
MKVSCSHCNANYTLTGEQVSSLTDSTMQCARCGRRIKIAFCPECRASYSITFAKAAGNRYTLTCQRCGHPFIIEISSGGKKAPQPALPLSPVSPPEQPRKNQAAPVESEFRETAAQKRPGPEKLKQQSYNSENSFSPGDILRACGRAFTPQRLLISSAGIIFLLLSLIIFDAAAPAASSGSPMEQSGVLYSFISFIPVILFIFFFLLIATAVSRITLMETEYNERCSTAQSLRFTGSQIIPITLSNIVVLLLANTLLILFGKIPLIGPIFYSLLFLPIYVISVIFILFCVIALWFYPPVLAQEKKGFLSGAGDLLAFIKSHNLTLLIIIPVLIITSTIIFTFITMIHHGALSIAVSMSKSILQSDLSRVFTAIPFSFQKIIDFPFMLSRIRTVESFIGELIVSYHVGGIILGVALSAITVLIYAGMASFIATISTYVFVILEKREDVEDRKKIELLLLIVLLLAALLLFKKLFL